MPLPRLTITEDEYAYHREKFRLSSLGCDGYTVGVCAALLCMVASYTDKTPKEIGGLTGQQLWDLTGAGFRSTLKIPALPKQVNDYLSLGERFSINLGIGTFNKELPVGQTLGEIYGSAGVDIAKLGDLISDTYESIEAELT
jgi:hypothetical protein